MQVMSAAASGLLTYCSLKLSEHRLHQKAILPLLRFLSLSFFCLETFQRANSFFLDGWRQSSQSCGAASAMLHCTYYNPNRVMARGYLHAVEVTFLSAQLVCVVRSRQLSDVNITGGHGTGCLNEQHDQAIPTIISCFLKLDTPLITKHILFLYICEIGALTSWEFLPLLTNSFSQWQINIQVRANCCVSHSLLSFGLCFGLNSTICERQVYLCVTWITVCIIITITNFYPSILRHLSKAGSTQQQQTKLGFGFHS